MSGIAGIYNLDGRPVDPDLLRRMTDVIAERGPDASGHWVDGPVGLGHRMLHTTPESLREKQPLTDETGNLCLVLDGRVDNREELRAALEARGARLRDDTDAEMVLRAYGCWGTDCLKRIIGDFAFVIWDGKHRYLFCARDFLGMRPLYYYLDNQTFLCGSGLALIFEDNGVSREPNEGMIGEYLASTITNKEETLYKNIFRLPPSHFLIVGLDYLKKKRYWDIDPSKRVRYRTDEEYADHFSEIFKEAVRCRLRSHGLIGSHLSGGLDSSSVTVTAQSIYREGVIADPGFETFSEIYPSLPCDESIYIQDIIQMISFKANKVASEGPPASAYAEHIQCFHDFPGYPNSLYQLSTEAREKGFRTILTGLGGNLWVEGRTDHLADHLRRFKIISLIRQARYDSTALGNTSPASLLLGYGLRPLVPRTARRLVRWVRGRRYCFPSIINRDFAYRIHLNERLQEMSVRQRFASFAQKAVYLGATCGGQIHCDEINERFTSWLGLEERHPFNDRRVVEFALALPEEQRWREDRIKFILRQSMRNRLPEKVRRRIIQSDFSILFVKAFQRVRAEDILSSLVIASLGWIDQAQVLQTYRQMMQLYAQGDARYAVYVWPLWMVLGIELWFKSIFLHNDFTPPKKPCLQGVGAYPMSISST